MHSLPNKYVYTLTWETVARLLDSWVLWGVSSGMTSIFVVPYEALHSPWVSDLYLHLMICPGIPTIFAEAICGSHPRTTVEDSFYPSLRIGLLCDQCLRV